MHAKTPSERSEYYSSKKFEIITTWVRSEIDQGYSSSLKKYFVTDQLCLDTRIIFPAAVHFLPQPILNMHPFELSLVYFDIFQPPCVKCTIKTTLACGSTRFVETRAQIHVAIWAHLALFRAWKAAFLIVHRTMFMSEFHSRPLMIMIRNLLSLDSVATKSCIHGDLCPTCPSPVTTVTTTATTVFTSMVISSGILLCWRVLKFPFYVNFSSVRNYNQIPG